jgi:hypothetical protein
MKRDQSLENPSEPAVRICGTSYHSGSGFSVERLKISDDEYRLEALNSSRPISRPSVFKSRFTPSDISRGIEVNYRVV